MTGIRRAHPGKPRPRSAGSAPPAQPPRNRPDEATGLTGPQPVLREWDTVPGFEFGTPTAPREPSPHAAPRSPGVPSPYTDPPGPPGPYTDPRSPGPPGQYPASGSTRPQVGHVRHGARAGHSASAEWARLLRSVQPATGQRARRRRLAVFRAGLRFRGPGRSLIVPMLAMVVLGVAAAVLAGVNRSQTGPAPAPASPRTAARHARRRPVHRGRRPPGPAPVGRCRDRRGRSWRAGPARRGGPRERPASRLGLRRRRRHLDPGHRPGSGRAGPPGYPADQRGRRARRLAGRRRFCGARCIGRLRRVRRVRARRPRAPGRPDLRRRPHLVRRRSPGRVRPARPGHRASGRRRPRGSRDRHPVLRHRRLPAHRRAARRRGLVVRLAWLAGIAPPPRRAPARECRP